MTVILRDILAPSPSILPRLMLLGITAITTVGVIALPHPLQAQTAEEIEQAKKLFKDGERLYKKGAYREAAEAFTSAYDLSRRDELLYYMGTAWEAEGELLRARNYYQLYLNNVPDAPNAEKILDKVLELQERIIKEMGRVVLTTSSDNVHVFIDAEPEPACSDNPCTLVLSPGVAHQLRLVDAENKTEKSQSFTLEAGEKIEVTISTEPEIRLGTLLVRSDVPQAMLTVNAKPYPLKAPIELEEGSYQVKLVGPSEAAWQGELEVRHDETTSILIPLAHLEQAPTSRGLNLKRAGAYSLISVSAGLLIGGALLGRQARNTYQTLDTRQQRGLAQDSDLIDQGRSQQRGANILFATGGLALGAGAGLLTWDLLSSNDASPSPSQDADATEASTHEEATESERENAPRIEKL